MDADHFLSQPKYARVSAHTTTPVNQCSADLMSRSCVHKRLLNRSPFAFRNSFTMLLQIPTSIRSGNTLPTPCTLLLRSQHVSTKKVACLREVPREERHLFLSKKHEFVKAECEEIEMHDSSNDALEFFQKI